MLERDNRDALSEQQQIYPSLLFLSLRWTIHRNWTSVWRCWIGQCKLLVNLKREQDEDHHPRQLPGGEDHNGPGAAQGDWARSRLLHRKCKWETLRLCHIIIAQRTDGFGGRGKKTGSDIVPLAGSFLGGALLRFFTSTLFCQSWSDKSGHHRSIVCSYVLWWLKPCRECSFLQFSAKSHSPYFYCLC